MQLLMRTYPGGECHFGAGEQVCEAASNGDCKAVAQCLSASPRQFSLNSSYSVRGWNFPALGHAARFARPDAETAEAAKSGCDYLAVVRCLLDANADPNAPGEFGLRPLMLAQGSDITLALINAKADVNAIDVKGNTALMHMAMKNAKTSVQALLAHGCDENVENKLGRVATDHKTGAYGLICDSLCPKLYRELDAFMIKDLAWLVVVYIVGNDAEERKRCFDNDPCLAVGFWFTGKIKIKTSNTAKRT